MPRGARQDKKTVFSCRIKTYCVVRIAYRVQNTKTKSIKEMQDKK